MNKPGVGRVLRALCRVLAVWAFMWTAVVPASPDGPIRASSTHSTDYNPDHAFDGDLGTRWASGPFRVEPEWIAIDLGRVVDIPEVVLHWEAAFAAVYELQVADEADAWRTVHRQEQGRGGREVIAGLNARGRHVRLRCLTPGPHPLFSLWQMDFPADEGPAVMADIRRQIEERRRAARDADLAALRGQGVRELVFAMRQPGTDEHWYANFSYLVYGENRPLYGTGGKLCILNIDTGEVTVLLDDPAGGIRDPAVHYDAKKILFSYRKGGSAHYHLYEIDVEGGNLRQLTDGPRDDIEPCYLPDGGIAFVSSRANRWVQCWLSQVAVLYRCDADGRGIRPLSANVEHDNTPWPLPDGRILYTRWEYVDRSQVDYHHLWTVNPDGTGHMTYYGNMHPGEVIIGAKPIPGSRKVVATFSPGHGRTEHVGRIALVDPRRGPDARESVTWIAREPIYRDPWAFSEDAFVVASGRTLLLMDGQGRTRPLFRARPEEAAAGLECFEPRPLIARPREPVIVDRIDLTQSHGRALLADVYDGRAMAGVERGEIRSLLVMESLPKPVNFTGGMDPISYGGTFTLPRILGTVPVDPDGSAYMELPAMRPLFFVALDEHGMSVKRMHSFLTVQPGETIGCVGCHEPRTQSPRTAGAPSAMRRPPSRIEPIAGYPDVFDFPRDVQPVLDALCADCHGPERTERGGPYSGGVALTGDRGPMFSHAYFTLTVRRLFSDNRNDPKSNLPPRAVGSSASRILRMLDGSHHDVRADERQKTILRLWIESGAPYPGTYAALGGGSIGGYIENNQIMNNDKDWPTTRAGAGVIDRRCVTCHQGPRALPRSMSDELGISFWRFSLDDPRLRFSRHIVFNLSRPELSRLLRAPLAAGAGGFGLCRDAEGRPAPVFADTGDPDYRVLLDMIAAGKRRLDEVKRFDMPGFLPPPEYLREMKRYGILPADHANDAPLDAYELDQLYWRSFWHEPRINSSTLRD